MPEIGNISPYFSLLGEASAITGLKTTTPIIPCARDPDTVVGQISFSLFPARKCPSCPSPILPTCSENGIGFREKCFYFVQNETNWNESQSFCLSLGAQLATIDSQEDLSFLLRYGRPLHYWVGLHQEGSDPWRWCNGSLFNNRFDIQGNGQCAYIDLDGVSSDWCSQQKYLVCSHPLKSPRGA
uniref:C-type lectin domain-containing protein n=1 Tax=Anas platyrhynchos TaxID=8839 RepID=A0A8B9QX12_ANAPL